MMSRGIALERVVEFFRESNLDVAEITLMHVGNIVGQRRQRESTSEASQAKTLLPPARKRRGRKPRVLLAIGEQPGGVNALV
jgi:hypothetical protein